MQNPNFTTPTHLNSSIAASTAAFMSRVYTWMTIGILLSGSVAYQFAHSPALMETLLTNRFLMIALVIVQFGAVIVLSAAINKLNFFSAALLYLGYAALSGATLSTIFLVYTKDSITAAFTLTAFSFAGLSGFGYVTKRDLGPFGSFCMMGLWGIIGFSLLSMFFPSMLGGVSEQVLALCGVVVFAGLTAYDTQKIKSFGLMGRDSESTKKASILGALTLYLDFVNLFLMILRLMGGGRSRD